MADHLDRTSVEGLSVDELFGAALSELQDDDGYPGHQVELHRRGTPEIFEKAMRLTHSADDDERELGIMVLRELGPPEPDGRRPYSAAVIPRLLELLQGEQDPYFERSLLQALAFNGAREALSEFTSRVDHPDVGVRRSVAFQLPSVVDPHNVDPAAAQALEVLSRDEDPEARYYAVYALVVEGLTFDRAWLEGIAVRWLQDPDRLIRQRALNFLPGSQALYASWTSSELVAAVAIIDVGDECDRAKYVSELRRRGDRDSADAALAALVDSSPQLRSFGAEVLGRFGHGPVLDRPDRGRFITALMAVAATETDAEVIDSVASALGQLQAVEAVPWLRAPSAPSGPRRADRSSPG